MGSQTVGVCEQVPLFGPDSHTSWLSALSPALGSRDTTSSRWEDYHRTKLETLAFVSTETEVAQSLESSAWLRKEAMKSRRFPIPRGGIAPFVVYTYKRSRI